MAPKKKKSAFTGTGRTTSGGVVRPTGKGGKKALRDDDEFVPTDKEASPSEDDQEADPPPSASGNVAQPAQVEDDEVKPAAKASDRLEPDLDDAAALADANEEWLDATGRLVHKKRPHEMDPKEWEDSVKGSTEWQIIKNVYKVNRRNIQKNYTAIHHKEREAGRIGHVKHTIGAADSDTLDDKVAAGQVDLIPCLAGNLQVSEETCQAIWDGPTWEEPGYYEHVQQQLSKPGAYKKIGGEAWNEECVKKGCALCTPRKKFSTKISEEMEAGATRSGQKFKRDGGQRLGTAGDDS